MSETVGAQALEVHLVCPEHTRKPPAEESEHRRVVGEGVAGASSVEMVQWSSINL